MDEEPDLMKAFVPVRVDVQHEDIWIQYPMMYSYVPATKEEEIHQMIAAQIVKDAKGPEIMVPMVIQDIVEQLEEGRAFIATLPDRLAAPQRLEPVQIRVLHEDMLMEVKLCLDINKKNTDLRSFVRTYVRGAGWPVDCGAEVLVQLLEQVHQLRRTNPRKGTLTPPDPAAWYSDDEGGAAPGSKSSSKNGASRKRAAPDEPRLRNTMRNGVVRRLEEQEEWAASMRKLSGEELNEFRAEYRANWRKKRDDASQGQHQAETPQVEDSTGVGKRSRRLPARLASGQALTDSPELDSARPSESGARALSPAGSLEGSMGHQTPRPQMYRPEPQRAQEWREPGYLQSLGGAVLPNAFPRRDAAPLGRLAGGTPPADAPRPPGDPGGPPMGATPLGMPPAAAAAFAAAAAYGGPQGIGGGLGVGMDLGPGGAGVGAYDGMIWGGARTTPQPTVPESLRIGMGGLYPVGPMGLSPQPPVPMFAPMHGMYSPVPQGPLVPPGAHVLNAAAQQKALREHLRAAQHQQQHQQQQQMQVGHDNAEEGGGNFRGSFMHRHQS